jgi:uncharacterized protein
MSAGTKSTTLRTHRHLAMAALLAASVLGISSQSHADLQAGVTKYQAGDYKGALDEWKLLADKNDPNALFNIGQSYRLGRGVAADAKTALDYYMRAATLGHVAAQGNAGTLLYFSEAPLRDRAKAVEWWQKASINGDPRAQYMLGVLHFNGEELPKDWPRAYALTVLARDSGLQEASTAITQMDRYLSAEDKAEAATLAVSLRSTNAPAAVVTPTSGQIRTDIATPKMIGKPAMTKAEPVAAAAPVVVPPPPKMATPAPADQGAGWRVQLGAFSNEASAMKEWTTLQSRSPKLKSGSAIYDAAPSGVVRLQTGSYSSRSAADSYCNGLKSQGVSCFVVKSSAN